MRRFFGRVCSTRTVWPIEGGKSLGFFVLFSSMLVVPAALAGQRLTYAKEQPLYPAFEGWTEHPDGSQSFLFGYINENWEETLHIPVGTDNFFSPRPGDRGQQTYFLPRRNRFVFEVPVPEDLGPDEEMTWTVRANGQEYRAFATLRQDYFADNVVIMSETGGPGAGTSGPEIRANEAPAIEFQGDFERAARVGEALSLVAFVTNDGGPYSDVEITVHVSRPSAG